MKMDGISGIRVAVLKLSNHDHGQIGLFDVIIASACVTNTIVDPIDTSVCAMLFRILNRISKNAQTDSHQILLRCEMIKLN